MHQPTESKNKTGFFNNDMAHVTCPTKEEEEVMAPGDAWCIEKRWLDRFLDRLVRRTPSSFFPKQCGHTRGSYASGVAAVLRLVCRAGVCC